MSTLKRVADRPTWLLSRANARAQAILTEAFATTGVRGYHFRMLAALDQYGPSSQAELGRATGIDRSDVVAMLDDLTSWGLARRDPDPDDRRRNVVSITEDGLARLAELDAVVAGVQDAVLEPLSSTERKTLLRLLRKLA
jgi:MarR family transcriptional regulator, lower aerobic nicotinate degradation pathway regulator